MGSCISCCSRLWMRSKTLPEPSPRPACRRPHLVSFLLSHSLLSHWIGSADILFSVVSASRSSLLCTSMPLHFSILPLSRRPCHCIFTHHILLHSPLFFHLSYILLHSCWPVSLLTYDFTDDDDDDDLLYMYRSLSLSIPIFYSIRTCCTTSLVRHPLCSPFIAFFVLFLSLCLPIHMGLNPTPSIHALHLDPTPSRARSGSSAACTLAAGSPCSAASLQ